ncbi:hypothetical protein ACFFGV_19680 [Pontibacillus salicampi]|uniref:Fur-regulated basic protein FbpA n=1 Tax=Pontibacillus salicampi TaxID=1449801 RepID=A0ABV6LTR0_9BACI
MSGRVNHLRRAVELYQQKQKYINELNTLGYERTPDGINIHNLNLVELEQTLMNVRHRNGYL